MKITVEHYQNKATFEINSDSSIDEVIELYKCISLFCTYSHRQWQEAILDLADEYKTLPNDVE